MFATGFLPRSKLDAELRDAIFRVAVREEVHMALLSQRTPVLPRELIQIDRSFSETDDDDTWAMRIIVHCREILIFALSDTHHTHTWSALAAYADDWANSRPESFDPIYRHSTTSESEASDPEIWFLHETHSEFFLISESLCRSQIWTLGLAMIFYRLCQILLALSNPSLIKIGLKGAIALQEVDVRNLARYFEKRKILIGRLGPSSAICNRHLRDCSL